MGPGDLRKEEEGFDGGLPEIVPPVQRKAKSEKRKAKSEKRKAKSEKRKAGPSASLGMTVGWCEVGECFGYAWTRSLRFSFGRVRIAFPAFCSAMRTS